ncbi:MAG: phage tail protein [Oscillospiraceae bacterium]|nr:phage tail protein [Oscillospiraceae bacterium]
MLNIYKRSNREKLAVLQNAFDISETEKLNDIWNLTFSLPANDLKVNYCKLFNYVSYDGGQLYRIYDFDEIRGTGQDKITYACEHVIATLADSVIAGQFQQDNLNTKAVIINLLNRQDVKNWVLADCDFSKQFSYSWTDETVVSAVFSITQPFLEKYQWVYNTSVYPWRLSLKILDESQKAQYYIRNSKNLLSAGIKSEGRKICTRMYGYGYGEGVNRLNFAKINGGRDYMDANAASITKYGIISQIYINQKTESAQTLLQETKALLQSYSQVYKTYQLSVTDIYKATGGYLDKPESGKIILFDEFKSYIIEVTRQIDKIGGEQITVANKPENTADIIAKLSEKQRISQSYAQGNTFLYPQQVQDNADAAHPLIMRVFVPAEARIINSAILSYTLENFRAYETGAAAGGGNSVTSGASSRATSESGGSYASTQTSSSGGNSTQTSSSGGNSTQTSTSGGGTSSSQTSGAAGQAAITQTSAAAGQASVTSDSSSSATTADNAGLVTVPYTGTAINDYSTIYGYTVNSSASGVTAHKHDTYAHRHEYYLPTHRHNMSHTHKVTTPSHTHSVTVNVPSHAHNVSINIPSHTHSVTIPAHTHSLNIPAHTHTVVLNIPSHTHPMDHTHNIAMPSHTHPINYGIYEGGRASSVTVKIDGKSINFTGTQVDIAKNFAVDDAGQITRGTYHEIQIIPNALTRITANITVQMFIQSIGGGNY